MSRIKQLHPVENFGSKRSPIEFYEKWMRADWDFLIKLIDRHPTRPAETLKNEYFKVRNREKVTIEQLYDKIKQNWESLAKEPLNRDHFIEWIRDLKIEHMHQWNVHLILDAMTQQVLDTFKLAIKAGKQVKVEEFVPALSLTDFQEGFILEACFLASEKLTKEQLQKLEIAEVWPNTDNLKECQKIRKFIVKNLAITKGKKVA